MIKILHFLVKIILISTNHVIGTMCLGSGNTVVEHLIHVAKIKGLTPATVTRREKMVKKVLGRSN